MQSDTARFPLPRDWLESRRGARHESNAGIDIQRANCAASNERMGSTWCFRCGSLVYCGATLCPSPEHRKVSLTSRRMHDVQCQADSLVQMRTQGFHLTLLRDEAIIEMANNRTPDCAFAREQLLNNSM